MYKVVLKPGVAKQLMQLEKKEQHRLATAIDALAENPFMGKKLQGKLDGFYSMRVWPFRIIYFVEKKNVTVTVVALGQRKDVYRRLS